MLKALLKPAGAGQPIEVAVQRTRSKDLESYDVLSGERHANVELEMTGPGVGWLRIRGRIVPFRVTIEKSRLQVWIRGRVHHIDHLTRAPRRARMEGASVQRANLAAPMPGTVLKINVQPGDHFAAHAALVVMESMKMELTLSAPHEGRVREIRCRPGQLVAMGDVLMTFHENDNGPVS